MHVVIEVGPTPSGAVVDPDDFTRFEVRASTLVDPEAFDRMLRCAGVGRVDGNDAWVDRNWLHRAAGDGTAAWESGFTAMLAFAGKHGWLSDDGTAIRAHIVWPTTD
jgi:hypothetical protein